MVIEQQPEHPMASQLRRVVLETAEQVMREAGAVPPPTVHIFIDTMDPPYAGYVTSRQFRRGADAAAAIARLGELPASMYATRLLVAWEHADLMTALQAPGEVFPTAIVTVEATFDGHVLHWHPYDFAWGPTGSLGVPTVQPTWRPTLVRRDGGLPEPIRAALERWRDLDGGDFEPTVLALQRDGYRLNFTARR
ncbi:hypothetical protein GCM10010123_19420 [Pilimelia anulata]|uniref:Uncharacterized protein n=1 Tax=Pilimelia anulata TaxID=53371 RepID=A0A8J3FC45_9ACTN|nr:hypothetical protein [Pilimelia anulata]GGJ89736.1 hypothetical protein GCM10010123_19420 [Pilimelia anulata]